MASHPIPTKLSKATPKFLPMTIDGSYITASIRAAFRDGNGALAFDLVQMYDLTWPEGLMIRDGKAAITGDNFTGYTFTESDPHPLA